MVRVLLISGLSITRTNSFTSQLALLAHGFRDIGYACSVVGHRPYRATRPEERFPRGEWPPGIEPYDVGDLGRDAYEALLTREPADVVLFLGYPDQFPALSAAHETADRKTWSPPERFLWAQFSRPPRVAPIGTTVVALTERTRAVSAASGLVTSPRVIPHAVDARRISLLPASVRSAERRRFGVPEDARVVGYVGVNQHRKRFERLAEVFARIRPLVAGSHLLIKTDRLRSPGGFDLPELTDQFGDSVTILDGARPTSDLARLYGCMDIYLHVSEWEGFGIPAAEALAAGVPIVTHEGQGPGEYTPFPGLVYRSTVETDEGGTELRVPDADSAAEIAARVLLLPAPKRAEFAARSRRFATEHFSLTVVAEAWRTEFEGR